MDSCYTRNIPYMVPRQGSVLVFSCNASDGEKPEWILPHGIRIQNNNNSNINNSDNSSNDNDTMLGRESDLQLLEIKDQQLVIHGIQPGMDGQYTCVQRNRVMAVFFIPYIIANVNYTASAVMSLIVSIFFAIACIVVLIVSRYYSRRNAQNIALVSPESTEMTRKQNLITENVDFREMTIP